jgi:hypothetical protein
MLDWLDRVRQSAGSILSEFNEDFWNLAGTDLFRGLSFQITRNKQLELSVWLGLRRTRPRRARGSAVSAYIQTRVRPVPDVRRISPSAVSL